MANIQVFEYQNNKVRTVDVEGEAWFVLKDVCEILRMDTTQLKKVADRLDEDEKGRTLITTPGGMQETWIVNESGLYHVILRSDKPEAAPFRRWVTNDVLPAIRKTGSYNAPQLTRSQLLATALIAAHEELEEKDKQIETMKPKALFADAVSASNQSILVGEMAKLLSQNGIQMGQNRLFQWMRENGYLIKDKKRTDYNMPTQKSMELRLFEIKETSIAHSDGHTSINKTPKVTGIGQVYFVNLFLKTEKSKKAEG
jgi:anti-repressor protein|nr:MAG TPA: repressor domain protein [Caudoviricetes sp.]